MTVSFKNYHMQEIVAKNDRKGLLSDRRFMHAQSKFNYV